MTRLGPMKTILLIDDDGISRTVIGKALRKSGWKVIDAEDGEIGLGMIEEVKPSVIICDLLMPRCNGFQVCRQIRERKDEQRQTKIIVTTSSGYATDRANALDAGADAFFVKPVDSAELIECVKRLASSTPEPEVNGEAKAQPPVPVRPPPQRPASPLEPDGERKPVTVKFWGVRGSIPTPGPATAFYGGNTSCVEVQADGEIIVLDAGSGIRPLGLELISEHKGQPINLTLLITHTHWDHIQGFPFFIPAYNPKNLIRILGYEGARRGLESTLSSQMESPYFPISMQQ